MPVRRPPIATPHKPTYDAVTTRLDSVDMPETNNAKTSYTYNGDGTIVWCGSGQPSDDR